MGFVREQGIYEKLKGTGLVPTMLLAQDGVIETQYEEGQNFYDVFLAAGTDPAKSKNFARSIAQRDLWSSQGKRWINAYLSTGSDGLGKTLSL